MGISEATFYNWKKKYGRLGVSQLRRLKNLEEFSLNKWHTVILYRARSVQLIYL